MATTILCQMWHLIPPHCRQHLKLRISHPKIVWWLWSLNFESVFFVEFRSAELWTKSWRCRQNMPIWTKFIDSQFLFCMTKELPSHGGLRKDEFQWNSQWCWLCDLLWKTARCRKAAHAGPAWMLRDCISRTGMFWNGNKLPRDLHRDPRSCIPNILTVLIWGTV